MTRILPIVLLFGCKNTSSEKPDISCREDEEIGVSRPTISFTFDERISSDLAGIKFEQSLRYLGEDSRYKENVIDSLGL